MNDLEKRFAAARRRAIATDYAHLNPRQLEGVLTTEGPLLLLAGAGLIGTMVLTGRIMLLTGPAAGVIAIAAAVRSIRNWQRKQFPEEKPRPLIVATILAMLVAALAWTAGWIAYRIWFGRTY